MPRYVARVASPLPVDEAFDLVADMRTFASWDPGIRSVRQVVGDGPGPGATFDVDVATYPRSVTLRYVTQEYSAPAAPEAPRQALLVAHSPLLTSIDRATVTAAPGGSHIEYEADLRLPGPLRLADPALLLTLRWIGRRFEAGLRRVTGGVAVAG